MTNAYFERVDDVVFRSTYATGGGWDPGELHVSPLAGVLVHAIRRHAASHGTAGLQLSRIAFDILGRLPFGEYTIDTAIRRPGRTIELIEATATIGGRTVLAARAWRLIASDSSAVATDRIRRMPPPDSLPGWRISDRWPGTFAATLEVRVLESGEPGPMSAWVRTRHELIAGEPDPVASYVALIDVANAIAPHRTPDDWFYPNVDLTVHLHRTPRAGWVGLDTSVIFGATGLGITTTVLHDEYGPVGFASQALTVRRRVA